MADVTSKGQDRIQSNDGQMKIGITEKDLKITQPNVPALGAEVSDLIITSQNNTFKIVDTGVVTMPEMTVGTGGGGQPYAAVSSVSIDYDPELIDPIVLSYTDLGLVTESRLQTLYGLTNYENESSLGTEAWDLLDQDLQLTAGDTVTVTSARLFDPVTGAVDGADLADGTELVDGVPTAIEYGGASELWGLELTTGTINNTTQFGFGISLTGSPSGTVSLYLGSREAPGIVVPTFATVTGVKISCEMTYDSATGVVTLTNGYTVTVYYVNPFPAVLSSGKFEGYYPVLGDRFAEMDVLGYVRTWSEVQDGTITFKAETAYKDLGAYSVTEVTNGPYDIRYYILVETAATEVS